jgi:hypothetical protein
VGGVGDGGRCVSVRGRLWYACRCVRRGCEVGEEGLGRVGEGGWGAGGRKRGE